MASISSPPVLVALGAAVGGCVTGLLLLIANDADPVAASSGDAEREIARLTQRVEQLADDNMALFGRLRDLELTAVGGGSQDPQPLGAGPEELFDLQTQLEDLAAAVEDQGPLSSARLVDDVAVALAAVRAAEEADRDAVRAERQTQRIERRLEGLTTELSLDAYQQGEMRQLLVSHQEGRDALDELRRTTDRDERREARDALRETSAARAAMFLTSTQVEQLETAGGLESRRDDRGRNDRRGNDNGGGGGGRRRGE